MQKSLAQRRGEEVLLVDRLIRAGPTDPTAESLQKSVVSLGQSGYSIGYTWVQARLRFEIQLLEARKAELGKNVAKEKLKEIDDQIYFTRPRMRRYRRSGS